MSAQLSASILIDGKPVSVVWTKSAARELDKRSTPIIVELELYFSCLVKKFVHFHEEKADRELVMASDKISLFFRPVTSTACTFEVAESLGRQPEIELENSKVRKMAPKRVEIDFLKINGEVSFGYKRPLQITGSPCSVRSSEPSS